MTYIVSAGNIRKIIDFHIKPKSISRETNRINCKANEERNEPPRIRDGMVKFESE